MCMINYKNSFFLFLFMSNAGYETDTGIPVYCFNDEKNQKCSRRLLAAFIKGYSKWLTEREKEINYFKSGLAIKK